MVAIPQMKKKKINCYYILLQIMKKKSLHFIVTILEKEIFQ